MIFFHIYNKSKKKNPKKQIFFCIKASLNLQVTISIKILYKTTVSFIILQI